MRTLSGSSATQYVARVSGIVTSLSFFSFLFPFYPRPMIPIISIRTTFSHSFVILEVNSRFRALPVILRGRKMLKKNGEKNISEQLNQAGRLMQHMAE